MIRRLVLRYLRRPVDLAARLQPFVSQDWPR